MIEVDYFAVEIMAKLKTTELVLDRQNNRHPDCVPPWWFEKIMTQLIKFATSWIKSPTVG